MLIVSTQIGNHNIGCIIGLIGLPTLLEGKQYLLIPNRIIIESPMITKVGDVIDDNEIGNKFENLAKKMKQDGIASIRLMPLADRY